MLIDKIHFRPKMQLMICTMLHVSRSVSLNIWCIERYVCFWPLWFSKPTISSTVITFSSVRVCFSLPVSCRWPVLHVSKISLNNILTLSLLQFIFKNFLIIFFENCIFKPVQVLNQSLVLNGTSPVYHQCFKNNHLRQYHLFFFVYKHQKCAQN